MKKSIPNIITCLNLFCGCLACIAAFRGDFTFTAIWVIAGSVIDFFDGLAARALHAYSPIGKELDSLADVITFGMAPGIAAFKFLQLSLFQEDDVLIPWFIKVLPYIAFLIPIFSALRLAKFNVDDRQTSSFIGLAVPANALFWVGLLSGLERYLLSGIYIPLIIICLVLIFSYLLVSEIPMFSLKVKDLSWKSNKLQYILVICMLIFVIIFRLGGISLGIITYIILSIVGNRNRDTAILQK